MRLLRPKNAVMAPMSQMSSSLKPWACSAAKSVSSTSCERSQTLSHHAIQALVQRRRGDDDHLALALAEPALSQQQRVVVGDEGTPLGRPVREREENVGDEARLQLHLQDARAQIVGQVLQFGHGIARDRVHRSFSFRF
jgi:hypothetical protein